MGHIQIHSLCSPLDSRAAFSCLFSAAPIPEPINCPKKKRKKERRTPEPIRLISQTFHNRCASTSMLIILIEQHSNILACFKGAVLGKILDFPVQFVQFVGWMIKFSRSTI